MKRSTLVFFMIIAFAFNSYSQNIWNVHLGVPIGTTQKTIFDPEIEHYNKFSYSTTGISLLLDRYKKMDGFTIGWYMSYYNGKIKLGDEDMDKFNTVSKWYDNPDKNMSQYTLLFILEGNKYRNSRFHIAIPFGLGVTYAKACDAGMFAPCFSVALKTNFFITDRLGVFVSGRWLAAPKLKFEKLSLAGGLYFEGGLLYTIVIPETRFGNGIKNGFRSVLGRFIDVDVQR